MARTFQHRNEIQSFIKGEEVFNQLSECKVSQQGFCPVNTDGCNVVIF